ncbi:MAG: tRNA pseudouridine(55) synthase TruB [Christensenellales bacterium]|jgi:tRNA pseudouridine55 synthase
MNGFINILKPPGMTSSYAVVGVRRLLPNGVKVGHMGTLDPAAAGVLPIGVGFAARLFDYVIEKEKEYICEVTFGIETDTQDAQGKIISQSTGDVSESDLLEVIPRFVGDIMQTPPAYSAVLKNGKKLYSIARSGGDTTVPQRPARVESIEVLDKPGENKFMLKVVCGRGTYIRTICRDIGAALGCGAHCSFLLRSRAGRFSLDESLRLDELTRENIAERLLPADFPIGHMPRLVAPKELQPRVRNGMALPLGNYENGRSLAEGENARVYIENEFVGIGRAEGEMLRFSALKPAGEI